uniref:olfactory receptor 6M1-like n=1 Tax=Jaculus jaculus TaxID=51337 RepID=UPI001E1B5C01|nr:olfactory receptor 6M1-like [Jaculus jaculus]
MGNWSPVTEFTLTAFPVLLQIRIFLFLVFLLTYTLTAAGNITIITLICIDPHLQTPMYFFLSNLSFLDILYTTSVTPKLLACLVAEKKTISFAGCTAQAHFFFFLGTAEFILLAVMSFDRYVAVCSPLCYATIMDYRVCLMLVLGCWVGAFLSVLVPIIIVVRIPYCKKEINHFFCDSGPLLYAACVVTYILEKLTFILATLVILSSLAFTSGSYTYIISTILRIPSGQGHQKAFSTCASHMTVVSIVHGSNIFVYVRPNQNKSLDFDKVATVLMTVVTPLLNPFSYSLRNERVKGVLRDTMNKITSLMLRKI